MSGTEKSYDAEKDLPGPLSDAIRNGSLDKSVLQNAGDGDEALKAFASHQGEVIELDEATNKRLLRKIDWNLMPVMCIVYGLNYLDKTTLSYASVMGLRVDTNLTGNNYQWLSSMFYFGYLAWEYPTNRLLQRLPLGKYSAANIILWGATLCTFAAVSDFGGGVAVRFFLGVTEAAVTPGFALLTSQWYTKKEQGSRTSIWFSFNGFAQIFGGLVAYGIAKGTRIHGSAIEPWKIIFLVTGCLTICVGAIFFWVIPDSQLNARFLTQGGAAGPADLGIRFSMPWSLIFPMVAFPTSSLSSSHLSATQQKNLSYTVLPGGAVEVIALLVCGYLGDKFGHRLLISTSGLWISTLGMLLIVCLPLDNNIGRLFGYYLTQASPTPFVALLSLISTNVAGWTKKTTVAALYLIAYCVGNIIGPQTFRPADAPRYIPACIVISTSYSSIGTAKDKTAKSRHPRFPDYVKAENQEWLDLTDRENPEFVYTL
ncbi:unnamed protein product [Aureobasidium pullulans]|nr:unnamed protein product [Aureobasidium pullulans]